MRALLLLCLLAACSSPGDAHAYLQERGYHDITIVGWAPGRCQSYFSATKFVATSDGGNRVSGVVCFGAEPYIIED